ncbi:MAG: phospholipase C, phosphocholine-specific [Gammaproteobacteria bacterium]|nr:phospholipase C, phosphocholine-specific [Gammaproteobacteria bacterium]
MAFERRDFLRMMGISAGAAAGFGLVPKSIRDALAIPAATVTGTIQDVQHVVVLMQENRSFDHYLGTLRGVRGFGDPRPIPLPSKNPVWYQPKASGSGYTLPFRLNTLTTGAQCLADINHSWKGSHTTWKNYDAWVKVKGDMCMGHFTRADLPFYHALADAFTVCDANYCSVFGPTNPNRMFLFTGTSGLSVGNSGIQAVNNADDGNWTGDMSKDNPNFAGYTWTTYAERLSAAGVDWRVYQEHDNYGDNSLAYFSAFRNLSTSSEKYLRGRAMVPGSNAGNASASRGEYLLAEIEKDVRAGTLPQVSWIVGPYITTEHPEATPAYGEHFVSRLLAALTANPEVWAKTVFIINYDENGGFFDHLPAPLPALNANMGLSTVSTAGEDYFGVPLGLGVRTPMFVVSPWSKGGFVNSEVFDHTSVLRFLEQRFGVLEPNISPWRRAVTGDLTSALDFAAPDLSWPALPDTDNAMSEADASCRLTQPKPPRKQALPKQEIGQRPARALPYALQADGRIEAASGRYWLDFTNTGAAGAGLTVYATNRTDGPWYYTLEAGKSLSDYWSAKSVTAGLYDLQVHGPNGFLRHFKGDLNKAQAATGANPEVRVSFGNGLLLLALSNTGRAGCQITLKPNLYSTAAPRSYDFPAGASITVEWPIAASQNWFDISLSCSTDTGYLRRIAGHREDGYSSVSDPAIGQA